MLKRLIKAKKPFQFPGPLGSPFDTVFKRGEFYEVAIIPYNTRKAYQVFDELGAYVEMNETQFNEYFEPVA
jgi:hypothetical protein